MRLHPHSIPMTKVVAGNGGSLTIESACVTHKSKSMVALFVSTDEKRPKCGGSVHGSEATDIPGVFAWRDDAHMALVSFPEFGGWEVVASETGRYGFVVVLSKIDTE